MGYSCMEQLNKYTLQLKELSVMKRNYFRYISDLSVWFIFLTLSHSLYKYMLKVCPTSFSEVLKFAIKAQFWLFLSGKKQKKNETKA